MNKILLNIQPTYSPFDRFEQSSNLFCEEIIFLFIGDRSVELCLLEIDSSFILMHNDSDVIIDVSLLLKVLLCYSHRLLFEGFANWLALPLTSSRVCEVDNLAAGTFLGGED